jgi:hypothetical protein
VLLDTLKLERPALLGQLPAPLAQLLETDRLRLVGINQPAASASEPIKAGLQLLFGGIVARGGGIGPGREALELR